MLHEVISENPECTAILLDLKAAYDTVDRRLLWKKLKENFNINYSTTMRYRELFDYNNSFLLINGRKSSAIYNRRGLLQGSSLSPPLFNIYINDLLTSLNRYSLVKCKSVRLNHLAFADDIVLLSNIPKSMQEMLNESGDWADRNGMMFSPRKCIGIGEQGHNYSISGEIIKFELKQKYLGIYFNKKGIDMNSTLENNIFRAYKVLNLLASIGMNLSGFTTGASRRLYLSYIRPTLEYGLQYIHLSRRTSQKSRNYRM
jgi:hypothetical protein